MNAEEQKILDEKMEIIKKKAGELFDEIEDTCEHTHCDYVCEAISKEMGDMLLNHHGFSELKWAYRMARPKSEEASRTLEEVLQRLKDDHLYELYRLVKDSVDVVDMIENENMSGLRIRLDSIKEHGSSILSGINTEYWSRSKRYREEIDQLREAS